MNHSVMKVVHVVAGVDNKFSQHLAVAFASLLINISQDTTVHFYVLNTGLTEENQSKLDKTIRRLGGNIQFIGVDGALFEGFPVTFNINRAMYLRLAISEVLPSTVTKVIYLDCDVVVTENIVELWEIDLKEHVIAAVSDKAAFFRCKSLNLPEGLYFNSGIMVINLAKWREGSISEKVINYIARSTQKLVFPDQDALNVLLYNNWLELPYEWNVITEDMKRWRNSNLPAIIHYTGISKPWQIDNFHRYKNEYYKYLRMTEWKSFRPEINFKVIFTRITRKILKLFKWTLKQILPKKITYILKGRNFG
jgi:lipopolysaccharide biosynthesis glycosyltransferase